MPKSSGLILFSRAAEANAWRLLILIGVTGIVWVIFHLWTGVFISPGNLANLSVQMSITALLTCGLTWLLVAREIDLSVGSMQALIAVVIMQLMVNHGWSVVPAVALSILLGAAVGALQGAARVWLLIPSFIVTLAGFSWLRGATYVVSGAQTVAGASDAFYEIGNGALPQGVSLALILLATAFGLYGWMRRYTGLMGTASRTPRPLNWILLALGLGIAALSVWVFGMNGGLPYPLLVVVVVAFSMDYASKNTSFGRYVYAVGGNPESARRVGININAIVMALFVLMGVLVGLSAVIQASRLDSAPPNLGQFIVMNAISASIIGGTSLFGGVGTIGGAIIGALLMASITNGLGLAGVNSFYQMIITGMLLLAAVAIDMTSQRKKK